MDLTTHRGESPRGETAQREGAPTGSAPGEARWGGPGGDDLNGIRAAAIAHAKRGRPVFPCGPNKRPLTEHGFKDATTDLGQIAAWWTRWPSAMIGMPTGAISKCFVLDVDVGPAKAKDGEESLAELVNEHGPLPDTVEALTPRGGRHIYFRHPGGVKIPNSASKLAPHLDVRGDGGYVILPPSTLPDGRAYRWEGSSSPDKGVRAAPAPQWLLNLVIEQPGPARPDPEPRAETFAEGARNESLFRLGRSLRARGLGEAAILAALRAENAERCDPPLPDAEVAQIAKSACSKPAGASAEPEARGASSDSTEATLIKASSIRPGPVDWLWDGWLARGKVHILAGAPGTGKTSLALALAATATIGGRWPDGTRAEVGGVVIWSGEDDPADTLVPRLLAAGADLSRVWFVAGAVDAKGPRAWDPSSDLPALADALADRPPALLIVDPVVSAVLGGSRKNAEVRRALQPLVDLAQVLRCAVLGVLHSSKWTAGREPLDRVVLATAKLPDEEEGGRILARAKNNLGADTGCFEYALEPLELTDYPGVHTTRVLWGEALYGTARELLARAEIQGDPDEQSALDDAKEWLRYTLSFGPVDGKEIKRLSRAEGIAERTLYRAADALKVDRKAQGFGKTRLWSMCAKTPMSASESW